MPQRFSQKLQRLNNTSKSRTIQTLLDTFKDKSFAVLFLVLMAIPALPLPTGGISHIFEIIVIVLSAELMLGRSTIWLPRKWLQAELPLNFWEASLPRLALLIQKVEKYSRPRLHAFVASSLFGRLSGLIVLIFSLFAFLSVPFSGLDTLPSLGVVLLALALLLEDVIVWIVGLIVGSVGIGLVLALGKVVFHFL